MTGEPTYAALRAYHHCVTDMLDDPALVGDLLLIGIALARALHLGEPAPVGDGLDLSMLSRLIYSNAHHPTRIATFDYNDSQVDARGVRRIHSVLRTDIRRYKPTDLGRYHSQGCKRPMLRREGLCGRPGSHVRQLTDPLTGERSLLGACSNAACRAWLDAMVAKNADELSRHPKVVPSANRGGVLAHHLDEIDWIGLWRALDPTWVIPPEVESWKPPTLRLIVNDAGVEPSEGVRPDLVEIDGGWR